MGWQIEEEKRIERTQRELHADLAEAVRRGEMTPEEANEWACYKQDQWARGLS